jgi:hypothetical protein
MDVKRDSRRRRGVSRSAQPAAATPAAAAGISGSGTFEPVAASAASMSTDSTTPTMRAT